MITIVIPTYNRETDTLKLLESIYNQLNVEIEVIVVDDNSSDGTIESINSFYPKVVVFRNDRNRGPAFSRNRGILNAKGEIVVGFDSDVILKDNITLNRIQQTFNEFENVDGFAFRILGPDGKSDDTKRWWHPLPIDKNARKRFFTSYFSGTAYAFRKKAVLDAGLFPEILYMHYEELELAYRILDNGGNIMYCPEVAVIHFEKKQGARRSEILTFYKPRNQILVAIGCYPFLRAIVFLVPRMVYGFLKALNRGELKGFARAMVAAGKLAPRKWEERRPLKKETWHRISAMRRISSSGNPVKEMLMENEDDTRVDEEGRKYRHTDEKRIEHFLDFIKDQRQGSKILDIGCQSGDLCSQLQKLGHDPYGVEIIEELVENAKSKYPSLNFQCADCEKSIPFKDNHFDIVWAGDVIEHITFTDVFVNEVNRVLKKGGLFILTTPMHNRIKNLIIALYNFEKHFDPEFPHLRFYSVKSLKSVLGRRGLKIESVKYIGRIPPIASIMFAVARKENSKRVISRYRF